MITGREGFGFVRNFVIKGSKIVSLIQKKLAHRDCGSNKTKGQGCLWL